MSTTHLSQTLEHTELKNRTGTMIGQILHRSHRYCAACQGNHSCYVVQWPDGKVTKPCTADCKINADGRLQIG